MIAANSLMPYMPRLETLKVPPWYSSGASPMGLARARPASSFTSAEISARPLPSALRTMGVTSPSSMATATETSALLYWRSVPSTQEALAAGTLRSASAAARITKSLTERL